MNCTSDNMDSISVILSQVFFSFFFFLIVEKFKHWKVERMV